MLINNSLKLNKRDRGIQIFQISTCSMLSLLVILSFIQHTRLKNVIHLSRKSKSCGLKFLSWTFIDLFCLVEIPSTVPARILSIRVLVYSLPKELGS
jgi:hypothetical protein